MKYVVIGDVHGELDKLLVLMEKINKLDRIPIFVGDLQDRGPNSKEVIEYIKSNNFLCVKGNHDEEMIRMYKHLDEILNGIDVDHKSGSTVEWINTYDLQDLEDWKAPLIYMRYKG